MSEGDITLQRAMLGEYLKEMGHGDEFIIDMLNDYEDTGKLYGKALAAQEGKSRKSIFIQIKRRDEGQLLNYKKYLKKSI